MRFSLLSEHKHFFDTHHFIELEGLLSMPQITKLRHALFTTLTKRPPKKTLFQCSYNLSFESAPIKRVTHKPEFASLAAELFHTPSIRFAFDQTVCIQEACPSPFKQGTPLQEACCLSPLLGALILPLEDLAAPLPFFPLPSKAGNALFIHATLPLPWEQLFATAGVYFLMIGYCAKKTLFKADTQDPHAVTLKQAGYVFNEPLKDSTHALLV